MANYGASTADVLSALQRMSAPRSTAGQGANNPRNFDGNILGSIISALQGPPRWQQMGMNQAQAAELMAGIRALSRGASLTPDSSMYEQLLPFQNDPRAALRHYGFEQDFEGLGGGDVRRMMPQTDNMKYWRQYLPQDSYWGGVLRSINQGQQPLDKLGGYSADTVKEWAANMLAMGRSWGDIATEARNRGVSMADLAGVWGYSPDQATAFLQSQGVNPATIWIQPTVDRQHIPPAPAAPAPAPAPAGMTGSTNTNQQYFRRQEPLETRSFLPGQPTYKNRRNTPAPTVPAYGPTTLIPR